MRAIGIDMGKDTFHASFSDESVQAFTNTNEGIGRFLATLEERKYTKRKTIVGVEATGVYHLPLAAKLAQEGWKIVVINPIISARAIANDSLRRVKTDKRDANVIRTLAARGKGYPYVDTDEIRILQALCAERTSLVRMRAQMKQRLHAHTIRARAVLSGNIPEPYTALIKNFTKEIRSLEQAMSKTAEETQTLLRSIPGVGAMASALLIAHIGSIARFENTDQLAAYVGIDPRVYESGTSVHGKGYISKRGSSALRQILFSAAFIAQRHDPQLREYYAKKRNEGKHHFVVLCAIERRIVNRIFAVWTRGTPYERQTQRA